MTRIENQIEDVRETRAIHPDAIASALAGRSRRPSLLAKDGKMFIIAADHPGRGALGVGKDAMAMGNRHDLLRRIMTALSNPKVDGFLGTPDLVDDLAMMGALENKVVIGSINRGGLQSSVFEMDDVCTAYDPDAIHASGLDLAKLLLRINLKDTGSVRTLQMASEAINECVRKQTPILLEPFISEWLDGRVRNDLSTDAVIKSVAIASALGVSSAYSWLKLPVVEDMEQVMESTTLPVLLLGGDLVENQPEVFARWKAALALPGVRGLVVGRTLLYPSDGDVVGAVECAASMVHLVPPMRRSSMAAAD